MGISRPSCANMAPVLRSWPGRYLQEQREGWCCTGLACGSLLFLELDKWRLGSGSGQVPKSSESKLDNFQNSLISVRLGRPLQEGALFAGALQPVLSRQSGADGLEARSEYLPYLDLFLQHFLLAAEP